MKLVINKDRSVIPVGTWGTVNENNYEILDFEFPEELEEYNKRIVYHLDNTWVWDVILDNKAILTNAITTKGSVKAYIWCTKSDEAFETDVDFRTQLFEMNFYENENADGIVPTEEQVDGFNTMLTAMNAKIDEVDALEQTIETAEAERQETEATRVSNENTRESNESTRQTNEQTRQSQEADRERRTSEAIGNIEDKTAEYNANAEAKTTAFNTNATQKTNEFNSNYTQKVNDFNTNATTQKADFNSNASSKTSAFNSNAETKTNTFNTNATNKTNAFNSNATEKTTTLNDNASTKTSEFNTNAESKTTDFNTNATNKTNDFNDNATEKTDEFNTNAQEKIDEYDEHIVEYQAQIDELQEEVEELSENMPWNTTEQATEISVDDAAKYSKNKLELFGNTEQAENPSPDYPQPIHVVTGENIFILHSSNYCTDSMTNSWNTNGSVSWKKIDGVIMFHSNTANRNAGIYKQSAWLGQNFKNLFTKYSKVTVSFEIKSDVNQQVTAFNSIRINVTTEWTRHSHTYNSTSAITFYDYSQTMQNIYIRNFQIEPGKNVTPYQPYYYADYPINLGALELCKIGDYQDYLYKENGNWYKYGVIKQITIDGTENWTGYNSSNGYARAGFETDIALNPDGSALLILSNKFKGVSTTDLLANNSNMISSMRSTHQGIFIKIDEALLSATNINGFKEWLSNNNLTTYIALNTPTSTQITDETLIAQLDAIYEHLQLVKGTNNITVTASDLAPYMELSYMQDLKSKLDNLDSRLSLLE